MKKQRVRLLADKGPYQRFLGVLIFSTLAHVVNIHAADVLSFADSGVIPLGIDILAGKKPTAIDERDSSRVPITELLGITAEELSVQLESLFGEHATVLANFELREATLEQLPLIADGSLSGPNGTIKNGKFEASKTNGNNAVPFVAKPNSFNLPSLGPLPLLTGTQSVAEGGDVIVPCGPGCSGLKKLAQEISANGVGSVTVDELGDQSDAVVSSGGGKPNFVPVTFPGVFASAGLGVGSHTRGARGPASSGVSDLGASVQLPSTTNSVKAAEIVAGFDTNPIVNSSNGEVAVNSKLFEQMPEGWFIHKDESTGFEIRGALDQKFDHTNPDSPNNFIQIAVTKDTHGLKARVYTIKKCEIGCYEDQYDSYITAIKNYKENGFSGKLKLTVPGVVEAITRLTDATEREKVVSENQARLGEFISALKAPTSKLLAKGSSGIQTRDSIQRFLLRAKNKNEALMVNNYIQSIIEAGKASTKAPDPRLTSL